jgi:hypothetical protein
MIIVFSKNQHDKPLNQQSIWPEMPERVLTDEQEQELSEAVERLIRSPRAKAAWEGDTKNSPR